MKALNLSVILPQTVDCLKEFSRNKYNFIQQRHNRYASAPPSKQIRQHTLRIRTQESITSTDKTKMNNFRMEIIIVISKHISTN
jgi:hypothetical protein